MIGKWISPVGLSFECYTILQRLENRYGDTLWPFASFWSSTPEIFIRHLGFWWPSWIFGREKITFHKNSHSFVINWVRAVKNSQNILKNLYYKLIISIHWFVPWEKNSGMKYYENRWFFTHFCNHLIKWSSIWGVFRFFKNFIFIGKTAPIS